MKIDVTRDACCAQDDQLGPLEKSFELHEQSSLADFLSAVMSSRFLQFSSTHAEMSCRIERREVARVFSPYQTPQRAIQFVAPADTRILGMTTGHAVEFVFDRV